MNYISLFTGIGGFDLAFNRAGHHCVAMCERDKAAQSVLRHRFPGVPLFDDVTNFGRKDIDGTVEIVVGGSPCQSFSVAGLRKSLGDDRGNLAFEFCRIVNEFNPRWIVWENVPGVLSTRDNAFGNFLAALVGEDAAIVPPRGKWTNAGLVDGPARSACWRILDAQFFGVPQRRRRVFVVAGAGAASVAPVLFESEGVRRDSTPRRETRQGVATFTPAGFGGYAEEPAAMIRANKGGVSGGTETVVYDARGNGDGTVASAVTGDHANRVTDYTAVVVQQESIGVDAQLNADHELMGALRAHESGGIDGQFVLQQNAVGDPDVANTVETKVRHDYDNQVGTAIVAFGIETANSNMRGKVASENLVNTVQGHATRQAVMHAATVRRLTPTECERLQAFPDGWTAQGMKPDGTVVAQADTPRYKQLGNAVCVNVVEWIARRIP